MKLSTNFTLDEMTRSQTAVRRGIDNTPSDEVIENLKRLCMVLEEIRALVGKPITINSGYRGEELNKAIGGAGNSQHKHGCAADFRITGYTPDEIIRMILTAGIRFDQLIREFDSWVHISVPLNGKSWRKQTLVIDKQGTRAYGAYKPLEPKNKPKPLAKSRTIANATTASVAGAAMVATPLIEPASKLAETAQENPNGFILVVGLALLVIGGIAIYLKIDDRKKQ